MITRNKTEFLGLMVAGLLLSTAMTGPALAAGGHSGGHDNKAEAHDGAKGGHMMGGHSDGGHHMSFGEAGDPGKVDRTVEIIMKDNEYNISELSVKAGETIRFVLKNEGEFLHEFNIGMPAMHANHQQEMMAMMENGMMTATAMVQMSESEHMKHGMSAPMKHDDPNAKIVEPGKTGELIWKFKNTASLQFACNVPGHYESGMVGEIKFPHN